MAAQPANPKTPTPRCKACGGLMTDPYTHLLYTEECRRYLQSTGQAKWINDRYVLVDAVVIEKQLEGAEDESEKPKAKEKRKRAEVWAVMAVGAHGGEQSVISYPKQEEAEDFARRRFNPGIEIRVRKTKIDA